MNFKKAALFIFLSIVAFPAISATGTALASTGIQAIHSPAALPPNGSVIWTNLGPSFTSFASGMAVPITGLPGSTVTATTADGQSPMILTNCPATNCGWSGNFAPAAPLLWVGGNHNAAGQWVGNGPLTLKLNTPQRGMGFNIMADESGPFTATVCAYSSTNTLLGCVPFSGNGSNVADGSAIFVGLYDDFAEISTVIIDAGGALYPHDFAIGQVQVANSWTQYGFFATSNTCSSSGGNDLAEVLVQEK